MAQRLRLAAVPLALLISTVASAGVLHLSGTVSTARPGVTVTVRAWALGRWAVEHPGALVKPVAETTTAPGTSFTLDVLRYALPLRVEVSAKGHVARAFTVVLPEQAKLPPARLAPGRTLSVRVVAGHAPLRGAAVWGEASLGPWGGLPGRWRGALARQVTDEAGRVHCTVPDQGFFLDLLAVGPEGRWGELSRRNARGGTLTLRLETKKLPLLVTRRDGEPAPGVLVTCPGAPAGAGIRTARDGTATLWVSTSEGWTAVAEDDGRMAMASGTSLPAKGTRARLVLDTPPSTAVHITGAPGGVVIENTAFGGASPSRWMAAADGIFDLPVFRETQCLLWGPGLTPARLTLTPGRSSVAVTLQRSATVSGTVADPAGKPVAGVSIVPRVLPWWLIVNPGNLSTTRLKPLPAPLAVTGPDGRFDLGELPAAPMIVEARAPGYPPVRSKRLPLPPGAHPAVFLELRRGATLALRVTDPQGTPLEGVAVTVHLPDSASKNPGAMMLGAGTEGEKLAEPVASAATDRAGRATLRAVPTGKVLVQLVRSGYVTRTLGEVTVDPAGTDLGDVVLEPGVTVAGTVVDPDGNPVAGAQVMASRTAQAPIFNPTVTADGNGHFEVPDLEGKGELYLQARAEGWVPAPPVKVVLPPGGEVEVPVRHERTLSGRVVAKASGEPLAGAGVTASVIQTMTIPGMGTVKTYVMAGTATTADDGGFRIGHLAPGPLGLTITAQGYQKAKRQVEIPEDAEPAPVLIELERGAELRGRVLGPDGAPVAGALVETVGRPYQETQSGPDGAFVLDGLPAGTYEVQATTAELRGGGTGTAGSGEELIIRLQRPRRILGHVTGPEGEPEAGVRIQVWGTTRIPPAETGSDGSFTVDKVFPGDVRLRASKKGFAPVIRNLTVPDDRDPTVEIQLSRGGTVEGEVRGLSASELERCTITAGAAGTHPRPDGRFTLKGVRLGTVTVTASVLPGNRSRSAVTTVNDIDTPARVTIDFAGGIDLSGTVTRAGLPVQGLLVQAQGIGMPGGSSTATDSDGAFEMTGLSPGEYELKVLSAAGEPLTGRHMVLEQDTSLELEVPASGIEGTVSASDTGNPITGATLVARRAGLPRIERQASSGANGNFHFDELPDGDYTLEVTAEGYETASEQLKISDGLITHAGISLDPGEGVILLVREADGTPAGGIAVVALAGGAIGADFWAPCQTDGRCRLKQLPKGDWTLFVASAGAALVHVSAPGPEVPVHLRPTGTLVIEARPGEDGALWRARIVEQATGLAVPIRRRYNPGGTEWVPVPAGGLPLRLPEASYTIQGAGPAGGNVSRNVTVHAGRRAVVSLGQGEQGG
ncbi:MAG: hypothetical protein GXP47_13355 [Acidobacteria bacterium]|nr:hypothetical protein [Acidobacteriota bacterium]